MRNKDSGGLFGGKKGPSSATNSDRDFGGGREGSFDEYGEDLARSAGGADSVTSSPMIGSLGSGEFKREGGTPKEGRISVNWGRFGLKGKGEREKKRESARESLDTEGRSEAETETTGTEDEG